ncbi:MAG: hypothetical protein H0U64_07685 [Gemmatimonadaceae bacterium]|nr:hypothetical protein [Gemmatimonadaceae bacterium]
MIESQSRMAQGYGYIVCLIAVIAGLASMGGLVNSLFDYADPVHSDRYGGSGIPVTSYNAYKRAYYAREPKRVASERGGPDGVAIKSDSVPDATLRQMYQDDRLDHVENTRFRALKNMVSTALLLIVSIILFTIHWKWLRRQSPQTA